MFALVKTVVNDADGTATADNWTLTANGNAGQLVAEHGGHVRDHHGVTAAQGLDVGAAGERGFHPHHEAARLRLGHRNVLEAEVARTVEDLGPHG